MSLGAHITDAAALGEVCSICGGTTPPGEDPAYSHLPPCPRHLDRGPELRAAAEDISVPEDWKRCPECGGATPPGEDPAYSHLEDCPRFLGDWG